MVNEFLLDLLALQGKSVERNSSYTAEVSVPVICRPHSARLIASHRHAIRRRLRPTVICNPPRPSVYLA